MKDFLGKDLHIGQNKTINVKLLHNGQGKIKCPVCSEVMKVYQHDVDIVHLKVCYVCNQCSSMIAREYNTGGTFQEIEVEII